MLVNRHWGNALVIFSYPAFRKEIILSVQIQHYIYGRGLPGSGAGGGSSPALLRHSTDRAGRTHSTPLPLRSAGRREGTAPDSRGRLPFSAVFLLYTL